MKFNDMKLPAILLSSLFIAAPVYAGGPRIYRENHCYENVEEYVPGYYNSYGQYVGGYIKHDRRKVACNHSRPNHGPLDHRQPTHNPNTDDNSCVEGSILGGILGGGAGAAASRGDGRFWAIPLGIVGGAMVGCQVDGG
jgi:hypothetical protein